jgi:signal transduction histidine kinase/CheY-like chemotaxis protein
VRVAAADPALLAEIDIPALLDLLPSGVLVVDGQARPVQMNAAASRILGHALNPTGSVIDLGQRLRLRLVGSARRVPRDESPLTRALRGETAPAADYVVNLPGVEQPLCLRLSASPMRETRHAAAGAILVFTDVRAEYAASEQLARLHEAEHRLHLALEACRAATWTYEIGRDWLEWTPEISSAVGESVTMLAGPLRKMLGRIQLEDRSRVEAALRAAIARAETATETTSDLEVETRVLSATGRARWLLIKGRVYGDERGTPQRVTGIAMDLSERKEAEVARQMLAHGERLRALGQMASGIAHDLNQSLALISGYSEMARQEMQLATPDVNRIREMCEITSRAAIEGGQALKRLLSFARTQELLGENETVDVQEVVREAARLTAPRWRDAAQAEGRPIELEVQTEAGCSLEGSASALREALINMIFNAVDALPNGGAIGLRCKREGQRVRVEVSDTGTGIPPEVRPRIFDPFFTTKGERGTGLGLAQVLAIVERHRGTVELDSQPGRGTTFSFSFPASTGQPVAQPEAPEPAVSRAERSITIMVVDDEPQLARMAALALSQRGHHVLVARSGEEAVAQLQQRQVNLVVSDLGLGAGMNGWDLADAVRQRWPSIGFVLVTGWGAAISPEEARARGVHQVLAKPYRITELRQIADSVAASLETG